jgi:hypothetical protein
VLAAPAHQFPVGAILSAHRRHALVEWATAHDGLMLEDDYDAEFRYDRAGLGAVPGPGPRPGCPRRQHRHDQDLDHQGGLTSPVDLGPHSDDVPVEPRAAGK